MVIVAASESVNWDMIERANERIFDHVHRTPILQSRTINRLVGTRVFFKCENWQRSGAFKFRGALNAVLSIDSLCAKRGVVTHSSGNHGAALALAASIREIPAYVVMPNTAVQVKRQAAAGYGANVFVCKPSLESREFTAELIHEGTGASLVHPYNDCRVIAGQGTLALELHEQLPDIDVLMVPVGGGGLLSGVALAAKSMNWRVRVFGAEPLAADDAYRSFQSGHREAAVHSHTVADGLRTGLGELTFPIILRYADDILLANEGAIVRAMKILWERMKVVVEPSAAVPLAAVMENQECVRGKKVAIVLSGGNVDLNDLPWQQQYLAN